MRLVVVDSSSNIYIAGYVGATAYGDLYAGGSSDAAVFKLDSNGDLVWARLMGKSDGEVGTGGNSFTESYLMTKTIENAHCFSGRRQCR